jgi:hypothetical protein
VPDDADDAEAASVEPDADSDDAAAPFVVFAAAPLPAACQTVALLVLVICMFDCPLRASFDESGPRRPRPYRPDNGNPPAFFSELNVASWLRTFISTGRR